MKKIGLFLTCFLAIAALVVPKASYAQNKFGIHISSEADIEQAYDLVGPGGYVTFVIREDERDVARFTRMFQDLDERNLIPIVRIATSMDGGSWRIPELHQARPWAEFLGQLPWPDGRRLVVLFNEPNHAKEWGGKLDPVGYATIARAYWEELKRESHSFSVLPAGLDQAAPNSALTMDQEEFMRAMARHDEMIFGLFDGWSSHSYPNPGFGGSPNDTGRGSIRGYEWELTLLAEMGYSDDLPVYVTETGWSRESAEEEKIAANMTQAFNETWLKDDRVKAVTPFIISYTGDPFEQFSFMKPDGVPYQYYYSLKQMADAQNGRALYGPPLPSLLTYGN